jgi:hypothetical protein
MSYHDIGQLVAGNLIGRIQIWGWYEHTMPTPRIDKLHALRLILFQPPRHPNRS